MKTVLQVLILLLFGFSFIFANDFREIQQISLKKDEQKKILVKYGDVTKLFKFRWTLFKNDGLVVLRSYDKNVAQNILYMRHKNRSFIVEVKPRGADYYNVPYILVKFKEFKHKTNEALFELFLSDDKMQISLRHLENN